jgi:hypothetical protein
MSVLDVADGRSVQAIMEADCFVQIFTSRDSENPMSIADASNFWGLAKANKKQILPILLNIKLSDLELPNFMKTHQFILASVDNVSVKKTVKSICDAAERQETQIITHIGSDPSDTNPSYDASKRETNSKQTIFLSYSSKESDLADIVDFTFSAFSNVTVTRYTRDVEYRGSFKDFMKKSKSTISS